MLWKGLLKQVTLDSHKLTEASAQRFAAWQGHAQESLATQTSQVMPYSKTPSISADPWDLHPVTCLLLFQYYPGVRRPEVCVMIIVSKQPFQWIVGDFTFLQNQNHILPCSKMEQGRGYTIVQQ